MPDNYLSELFKTLLPAVTLLATGLVTVFLSGLKKKLEENTALTQKTLETANANADDQASGFKDLGKWRYEVNEKLAIMDQKFIHMEQRLNDANVQRLVTMAQQASPTLAPPVSAPAAAPPVPAPAALPTPAPAPQVTVVEVNQP